MASDPKSAITFIKFLVFDFSSELKLPSLFVRKYEKIIPRLCILRSHLGRSCEVSIVSTRNGYFFRNGWDKFQRDNDLKEGEILVFNLSDANTFQVFVYGSTCCLKNLQAKPQIQIPKPEPPGVLPTINPESRGKKQKEPQYSTDHNVFEYGNAKMGRKESKERDNKKPVNKHPESEIQLQSHSVVLNLKAYQRHNVAIPRSFAMKAGLKHRNPIVIECPKGIRRWPIQVWIRKENVFLSSGWSAFVQDNDLVAGDICILQTVQGQPNFITAEIIKSGTR